MRIVNIDETCLALDGGTRQRSRRPSIVYIDKHLPKVGKAYSECSMTIITITTGSSAAGEAILPHFQFSAMGQSNETMRLKVDILQFMPNITGIFGYNTIQNVWPVTCGMNLKGGMDDDKFQKYILAIKDLDDRKKNCQNMEKDKTEGDYVLKSGQEANLLLAKELDKLLLWHGAQKRIWETKMQN